MNFLCDPTILLMLLVVALIILAFVWFRGDPDVESPRSQMRILEEALRNRGFTPLIKMVRNFENYKEDDFLREVQDLLVPFSQDKEFVRVWLSPILMSNLSLIMQDKQLFMYLDLTLREEFGYRLKPIRHVKYGIRPEVLLHASSEEPDVCLKEEMDDNLLRGRKVYNVLEEEGKDAKDDEPA